MKDMACVKKIYEIGPFECDAGLWNVWFHLRAELEKKMGKGAGCLPGGVEERGTLSDAEVVRWGDRLCEEARESRDRVMRYLTAHKHAYCVGVDLGRGE